MHTKRKMYYSFVLVLFITLYENKIFSATQRNPSTPPRSGDSKQEMKFSPQGIDEIFSNDNETPRHTRKEDPSKSHLKLPRPLRLERSMQHSGENTKLPAYIRDRAPFAPDSSGARRTLKLNVFKNALETINNPGDNSTPAIKQFVNTIIEIVSASKVWELDDRAIGIAFNETAEKFKDHDYFSIDRFDGTLNAAQQEIENARLMNNWQKWYPYKLLACFYKKEAITKEDADIIASSMRSDDLDVYNSTTYYDLIYVPGKPFYTNKKEFGIKIYAEFVNKISGFSGFINSLNEDEDEIDTI